MLNFDFSKTAQYIVVGACIFCFISWKHDHYRKTKKPKKTQKKPHHIKLTASGKVILGKVLK